MLNKLSIFNHPGFLKIEENIWVINNFTTDSEIKSYINYAESVEEEEWWKENNGWYKGKYLNVARDPSLSKISNNIIDRFKLFFDEPEFLNFGTPASIHRMLAGQEMFVHADFPEADYHDNYLLFNTAIYHNRVDGGEIFYPELGLEYHPFAGDLVIHPGTTKYRHGVKPVTGDTTRYISTLWVSDTNGESIKRSGYMKND